MRNVLLNIDILCKPETIHDGFILVNCLAFARKFVWVALVGVDAL
jgi:hypothetical protein